MSFKLVLVYVLFSSVDSQTTLTPDPNSCNHFYIHRGTEIPIFSTCPQPLHFNPKTLRCEDPSKAKCRVSGHNLFLEYFYCILFVKATNCEVQPEYIYEPHPCDSGSFIITSKTPQKCEPFKYWSATKEECVLS